MAGVSELVHEVRHQAERMVRNRASSSSSTRFDLAGYQSFDEREFFGWHPPVVCLGHHLYELYVHITFELGSERH